MEVSLVTGSVPEPDFVSCILRRTFKKHMFLHFEVFRSVHSHIFKHLFNYTNNMHNIYSLRIFTIFLLRVAVFDSLFIQSDVTVTVWNTAVPLNCIVFCCTNIDIK